MAYSMLDEHAAGRPGARGPREDPPRGGRDVRVRDLARLGARPPRRRHRSPVPPVRDDRPVLRRHPSGPSIGSGSPATRAAASSGAGSRARSARRSTTAYAINAGMRNELPAVAPGCRGCRRLSAGTAGKSRNCKRRSCCHHCERGRGRRARDRRRDCHADSGEPIRIAVIDDHPAIAHAIEAAIAAEAGPLDGETPAAPRLQLVGAARNAIDGIALVRRTGPDAPDIALCDVQLQAGTDGLGVVEAGRAAGCAVIVLTSFDRSSLMRAAFERGASGFLHKSTEIGDVLQAIRRVRRGRHGVLCGRARFRPLRAAVALGP